MIDIIGERLKRLREEKDFSIRELAKRSKVSVSSIGEVETGTRQGANLTLKTGRRLARALGVTLDYLAFEEDI